MRQNTCKRKTKSATKYCKFVYNKEFIIHAIKRSLYKNDFCSSTERNLECIHIPVCTRNTKKYFFSKYFDWATTCKFLYMTAEKFNETAFCIHYIYAVFYIKKMLLRRQAENIYGLSCLYAPLSVRSPWCPGNPETSARDCDYGETSPTPSPGLRRIWRHMPSVGKEHALLLE